LFNYVDNAVTFLLPGWDPLTSIIPARDLLPLIDLQANARLETLHFLSYSNKSESINYKFNKFRII
jgi:hypothetical protein